MSNVRFVNRRLIAALALAFILALPSVAHADSTKPGAPTSPYRSCAFYVRGHGLYVAVTGHVKLYYRGAFMRNLSDGVWFVSKDANSTLNWRCR